MFNSDNKAIPVAWIIAPRLAFPDPHRWMRALYNRVHTKDPSWKLAGFIVDDPLADTLTIRLAANGFLLTGILNTLILFSVDIYLRSSVLTTLQLQLSGLLCP